jgi:hypothetical protein
MAGGDFAVLFSHHSRIHTKDSGSLQGVFGEILGVLQTQ